MREGEGEGKGEGGSDSEHRGSLYNECVMVSVVALDAEHMLPS